MLEVTEAIAAKAKVPLVLDGMLATEPTPRVGKLRDAFLSRRPTVSIDRARTEARVLRETAGEQTVTRRAKVFAAIVREMPIDVYPYELIVSCSSARPYCSNLNADGAAYLAGAHGASRGLTEEEMRELREELIPSFREL